MSTRTTSVKPGFKPALWTPGDWNAFFGFGTNILVNMLVLTGLLRFVLKMPDSLVFGRILPALGLMMCLSTFYYAYLAYRLAQKTGRSDVCALPSGVSVPHMFIVTFVIMLPITLKTGDPIKGWSAGLVWVFFQSFILMIGGFIAPYIRRITPRAARSPVSPSPSSRCGRRWKCTRRRRSGWCASPSSWRVGSAA
jgi:AGZA family xanthine/uracil permease-like MFS transporter